MPVETRRFLGRGVSFPFRFGDAGGLSKNGGLRDTEAVEHVKESIQQILGCTPGGRFMRRSFGCNFHGLLFEPNDTRLDAYIDFMIRQSIQRWEPRVIVGPITTDRRDRLKGVLYVQIEFSIIKTNVSGNLVWPYYLDDKQRQIFGEIQPVGESAMTTPRGNT